MSDKNKPTTPKFVKDEQGRYPAVVYTPESVGCSLGKIFNDGGIGQEGGTDILQAMLGNINRNVPDNIQKALVSYSAKITASFIKSGTTLNEIYAGVNFLLEADAASTDITSIMQAIMEDKTNGSIH